MSDSLVTALVSVVLAIVGVATIAVLVSPSAQTGGVISAGGSALAKDIAAAVSPVTGGMGGSSGGWLPSYQFA
jgi:hypothetical protein